MSKCKVYSCWYNAEPNSDVCSFHLRERKWKERHGDKPVFTGHFFVKKTVQAYNYKEYLNSEEWKLKSETKKIENPRCSLCNRKSEALHAHHRTYARLGNENSFDLTVLCNECHDLFHKHYWYNDGSDCFYPHQPIRQDKKQKSRKIHRKNKRNTSVFAAGKVSQKP